MTINKLIHTLLNSDNIVFTYIRSAAASLTSAVTDLGTRILLYSVVLTALPEFYRSNIAVATGAVVGGVVNCMMNYKFTFHAEGQSVKAVSVKFLICWAGNLLLNMYGTTLLTIPLSQWDVLLNLGFTNNQIFAMTTLGVAIFVSIFWNFTVQKYFVYMPNRFDTFAIRLVNTLNIFQKKK